MSFSWAVTMEGVRALVKNINSRLINKNAEVAQVALYDAGEHAPLGALDCALDIAAGAVLFVCVGINAGSTLAGGWSRRCKRYDEL
jgi:hypothetical protein